jgi:hypothetical protein
MLVSLTGTGGSLGVADDICNQRRELENEYVRTGLTVVALGQARVTVKVNLSKFERSKNGRKESRVSEVEHGVFKDGWLFDCEHSLAIVPAGIRSFDGLHSQ